MKDAEVREQELHEQFRDMRRFRKFTPGGEWFNAAPGLLNFIGQHAIPPNKLSLRISVFILGPGLPEVPA